MSLICNKEAVSLIILVQLWRALQAMLPVSLFSVLAAGSHRAVVLLIFVQVLRVGKKFAVKFLF